MTPFQQCAQLAENSRKPPVAINIGVIQGCRTSAQSDQVVQRIKYLFTPRVAAPVTSNNLPAGCDLDPVDVSLDRHRFKRIAARNAITVGVEGDSLILVNLGGLVNAGIKGTWRQRQGSLAITLEAQTDSFRLTADDALLFGETLPAEMLV